MNRSFFRKTVPLMVFATTSYLTLAGVARAQQDLPGQDTRYEQGFRSVEAAPAPEKKNYWPWIIGGVLVVGVIIAVAASGGGGGGGGSNTGNTDTGNKTGDDTAKLDPSGGTWVSVDGDIKIQFSSNGSFSLLSSEISVGKGSYTVLSNNDIFVNGAVRAAVSGNSSNISDGDTIALKGKLVSKTEMGLSGSIGTKSVNSAFNR